MKRNVFALFFFLIFFSAWAFADSNFGILSFEIVPSTVIFDAPGFETVEPVVRVTNWEDAGPATVRIEVIDSAGATVVDPALTMHTENIASGGIEEFSSGDVSFVVLSDWGSGLYTVYVYVYDSGGVLHDTSIRHLNVGFDNSPIPESSLLLLPLVAFSVLAVIFLSRKRSR